MYRYFAIYKPFEMLSQFTSEGDKKTLADLEFDFPKDVYPVGRLDADSEGLLLLTNDKRINDLLLNPVRKHNRTYLVQVEGEVTPEALNTLEKGIVINEKGKTYKTLPAEAKKIEEPIVPERNPPVRFRKNIPTSWIELKITEGKNRQVRKMTASTGFPALRLVRLAIGNLRLSNLQSGVVEEFEKHIFYEKLGLR